MRSDFTKIFIKATRECTDSLLGHWSLSTDSEKDRGKSEPKLFSIDDLAGINLTHTQVVSVEMRAYNNFENDTAHHEVISIQKRADET